VGVVTARAAPNMNMDRATDLLQFAGATFAVLAAVCGIGAYFTSKQVSASFEQKIATLEKETAGRRLSDVQRRQLVERLRTITMPQSPVQISGLQGNTESIALAKAILATFREAGLRADGVQETTFLGSTGPGILVRGGKPDLAASEEICRALQQAGLMARVVDMGDRDVPPPDLIEVVIAYRPPDD
jgi:hypothetical protein